MTGAGHTAGEWISRSDRTIAENGVPLLRFYAGRNEHQNAREAVASVNSYRRHFGPHAVSAAEGDLLGLALDTLADAAEQLGAAGGYWESSDLLTRIQSILSQAREVTR